MGTVPTSGHSEVPQHRASPATPPDWRYLRSRRAIRQAFVELVLERGYGKVSIELLMERADLARATFYAHYDSLEELLGEVVRELTDDLLAAARFATPTGPDVVARGAAISVLCGHAQDHRDLYRVILSGAGNGSGRAAYVEALARAASQVFRQLVRSNAATERISVEVVARSWAGSFTSLLDWWLLDQPDRSADEVTAIATALLIKGCTWGIGVEARIALSTDVLERLSTIEVGVPESAGWTQVDEGR